jgi:hypothetical protein
MTSSASGSSSSSFFSTQTGLASPLPTLQCACQSDTGVNSGNRFHRCKHQVCKSSILCLYYWFGAFCTLLPVYLLRRTFPSKMLNLNARAPTAEYSDSPITKRKVKPEKFARSPCGCQTPWNGPGVNPQFVSWIDTTTSPELEVRYIPAFLLAFSLDNFQFSVTLLKTNIWTWFCHHWQAMRCAQ